MIQIDTFNNKINKNSYTFGEFISEFPDLSNYALKSLNEKLKVSPNSNNFAIKMINKDNTSLRIASLITDLSFNETYTNLIPENGCNYIIDVVKDKEQIVTINCDVRIPTYSNTINILFEIKQVDFKIINEKKIKFPEDYFLKGYPILGELITQSVFNNVASLADHKKQYADFKQFCLHKIKNAA